MAMVRPVLVESSLPTPISDLKSSCSTWVELAPTAPRWVAASYNKGISRMHVRACRLCARLRFARHLRLSIALFAHVVAPYHRVAGRGATHADRWRTHSVSGAPRTTPTTQAPHPRPQPNPRNKQGLERGV
mmetsp:Transcript_34813/g.78979  ORF Transcript_34813/g.78979 Transcript_34813/m.78979 type:complete len:131 (-) Transcript_34813:411-803(-)